MNHRLLACFFMFFISNVAFANQTTVNVGTIKALSVSALLSDNADTPISVIQSAPLRTESGVLARGNQYIDVHLDISAEIGIVIEGTTITPGETKSITFNVDNHNGSIYIPIYPSVSNKTGLSPFSLSIPEIRGQWCLDGYEINNNNCVKYYSTNASWDCPTNQYSLNGPDRTCSATLVASKSFLCPDLFELSGESCLKTLITSTYPYCSTGFASNGGCNSRVSYSEPDFDCPRNYFRSNGSCLQIVYDDCPSGYRSTLEGDLCFADDTAWVDENEDCPSSTPYVRKHWNGQKQCMNVDPYTASRPSHTITAQLEISCSRGVYDSSSQQCVSSSTPSVSTRCPSGYTKINSSSCSTIETIAATPIDTCPEGMTAVGEMCNETIVSQPFAVCEAGYTVNDQNQCTLFSELPQHTVCDSGMIATENDRTAIFASSAALGGQEIPLSATKCQPRAPLNTMTCSDEWGYYVGVDKSGNTSCLEHRVVLGELSFNLNADENYECPTSHPYDNIEDGYYVCYTYGRAPHFSNQQYLMCGTPDTHHQFFMYKNVVNNRLNCALRNGGVESRVGCPDGLTLNKQSFSCEGILTQTPSFECPDGASKNGSICEVFVSIDKPEGGCPAGFTEASNGECQRFDVQVAKPVCPALYTFNVQEDVCKRIETLPYINFE